MYVYKLRENRWGNANTNMAAYLIISSIYKRLVFDIKMPLLLRTVFENQLNMFDTGLRSARHWHSIYSGLTSKNYVNIIHVSSNVLYVQSL